jgi:hypothetical protein
VSDCMYSWREMQVGTVQLTPVTCLLHGKASVSQSGRTFYQATGCYTPEDVRVTEGNYGVKSLPLPAPLKLGKHRTDGDHDIICF